MATNRPNSAKMRSRTLFDAAKFGTLSNSEWLEIVLDYVPDDVAKPWVWIAPNGGPALVGWGELARFEASGPQPMANAWKMFGTWARAQGYPLPAFGSFPFDPAQNGFLVAPKTLIARRDASSPTSVHQSANDPKLKRIRRRSIPLHIAQLDFTIPDGDEQHWENAVNQTRTLLSDSANSLEKVVLARIVRADADRPLDQRRIAGWLASTYPDCWTFAHDGLIGATPELLVEVNGGGFRCRILAGTRKPEWSEELLGDAKELHEHELSVTSVTDRLADAGLTDWHINGPFLLKLPNVTHLATDIQATVEPEHGAADIADLLFPTAAICGVPRQQAFDQIQHIEHIDRGRFSGPIGWVTPDGSGQWGLALRCAQLSDDSAQAQLFSGAGILPDSQADHEWLETDAKMEPMRRALAQG